MIQSKCNYEIQTQVSVLLSGPCSVGKYTCAIPDMFLMRFPWQTIYHLSWSWVPPPQLRGMGAPGERGQNRERETLRPTLFSLSDSFLFWRRFIYLLDKVPSGQRLIINVERGQRALCLSPRKRPGKGKDPSTPQRSLVGRCLPHQSMGLIQAFRCSLYVRFVSFFF